MLNLSGTPVIGYLSLVTATPGPVAFALFTVMGAAAYTLQAKERVYITAITLSSNDSANTGIVTVDSGGTTPTKFASMYIPSANLPGTASLPPGTARGIYGVVPRAGIASVTALKTIEIIISGYISST
jgi:hypothetical protein